MSRRRYVFSSVRLWVVWSSILFQLIGRSQEPLCLQWSALPTTPIRAGQPFTARVVAYGGDGTIVKDSRQLWLSVVAEVERPGLVISEFFAPTRTVEFSNVGTEPVNLTGWQVQLYDATGQNAPKAVFQFPVGNFCQPGGVFLLRPGGAQNNYPVFQLNDLYGWISDGTAGILLIDASGKTVDALSVGFDFGKVQPSQASSPWTGAPLPIYQFYSRMGSFNHRNALDWNQAAPTLGQLNDKLLVPFVPNQNSQPISPSTILLSEGAWAGQLVVPVDGSAVRLRADDQAGLAGDSDWIAVLPRFALTLSIPSPLMEGDQTNSIGSVSREGIAAQDTQITLTSSSPEQIEVPAQVVIPAGQTNGTFLVKSYDDKLLDGSQWITITASAAQLTDAVELVEQTDRETASIFLVLPSDLTEGQPGLAGALQVSRPPDRDVRVQLASDFPDRITFPTEVTVPQGQTNVAFLVAADEDHRLTGDQLVSLTATVSGWKAGQVSVLVHDVDKAVLSLSLRSPLLEGTTATNGLHLDLGGSVATNLLVRLDSQPSGQIHFVTNVVSLAPGQLSADLDLQAIDNTIPDGTRTVRITAQADGFTTATADLTVLDDEVHTLLFDPLPLAVSSGEPVAVRVFTADGEGRSLTNRQDVFELTAPPATLAIDSASPRHFTNGVWSGMVTLTGAPGELFLQATSSLASGVSAPFVLRASLARRVDLSAISSGQSPEMLYESASKRLFVLGDQGMGTVDPISAQMVLLAGIPGGRQLVRTDGGEFLYWIGTNATEIIRYDLRAGNATNFPMATDVASLQVVPGSPHRFVASTGIEDPDTGWSFGIFAFVDGQVQARGAGFSPGIQSYSAIVFTSPDNLYGYDGRFVQHHLRDDGVEFIDVPSTASGMGPYKLPVVGGIVYGMIGSFDPAQGKLIAKPPFDARLWPDPTSKHVLALQSTNPPRLRAFDLDTFGARGGMELAAGVDPTADLALWDGGVAVLGGTNLWLVEPGFLKTNLAPDVAIQMLDGPEPVLIGQLFQLRLIVTNEGTAAAHDVLVRYKLPPSVDWSLPSPTFSAQVSGDTIIFTLPSLDAGASQTIALSLTARENGPLIHSAEVATLDTEISTINNATAEETAVSNDSSVVARFHLAAGDLVWDRARHLLYASVNDDTHPLNGWVAAIDPATQTLEGVLQVGTQLGRMVISDDSRYLYVGTEAGSNLRRVDLNTKSIDEVIEFRILPPPLVDLASIPGRPGSIAIMGVYNSGAIGDGNTLRDGPLPGPLVQAGESPDVLYTFTSETVPSTLYRFDWPLGSPSRIRASGTAFPEVDRNFTQDGGLLFSSTGSLVLGSNLGFLGTFPEADSRGNTDWKSRPRQRLIANVSQDRAYYLQQPPEEYTPTPDTATLRIFSVHDRRELESRMISDLHGYPESFITCGDDLLAFRTLADQVLLLQAARNTNGPADVQIAQSVLGPAAVNSPVNYTIFITNQGPATAQSVVVRDVLPDGVEFLSASPSGWQRNGQLVQWTVGDLISNTSTELSIRAAVRSTFRPVGHGGSAGTGGSACNRKAILSGAGPGANLHH